jgi:hypothetical protein
MVGSSPPDARRLLSRLSRWAMATCEMLETFVIWHRVASEIRVIPAKAGIRLENLPPTEVDSRFRRSTSLTALSPSKGGNDGVLDPQRPQMTPLPLGSGSFGRKKKIDSRGKVQVRITMLREGGRWAAFAAPLG